MNHLVRFACIAALSVASLGLATVASAQSPSGTSLKTTKAKNSYLVGRDLAGQLPPVVREALDPATVAYGVRMALEGKKSPIGEAEAKQLREAFVADLRAKAKSQFTAEANKNKKEGAAFLASNKTKPGVKTTASGLQYKVITQGTGPHPGAGDTVEVNYTGTFLDGKKFDASADHGSGPSKIPLDNVIPGFREGLMLMQVGGHYKLYIPSDLAYGEQPKNGFPPNATIIFDVQLVKTTPPPPSDQ